jgi:hypothetical protein
MWWVLVLEAGVALFLLLFIVWWTMFSGKPADRSDNKPPSPENGADDTPGR